MNPMETEEEKKRRIEQYLTSKFQPNLSAPTTGPSSYGVDVSNSTTTARGGFIPNVPDLDREFAPIDVGDIPPPAEDLEMPAENMPKPVTKKLIESDSRNPSAMEQLLTADMPENPYKDEERQRIATAPDAAGIIGQALAGFGQSLAGKGDYLTTATRLTERNRELGKEEFDRKKKQWEVDRLNDPKSAESKVYQRIAAEFMGTTPDKLVGMSAAKISTVLPAVEKLYEQQTKRKESEADVALRQSLFGQKQTEAATKKAEMSKKLALPGYQSTGEVTIDETEAKKLREGLAQYKSFQKGLDDYIGMIKKYGTTEVTNQTARGQMQALAKRLQLIVKNLGQLGVLSASDIPFIEEQIPGPGIMQTEAAMLGKLNQSKSSYEQDHLAQMGARGYVPVGAKKPGAAPAATPAPAAGGYQGITDEEKQAALEWIASNPNDARAIKMKKALGLGE